MYALGPEPKQSNKWAEDRYVSYFWRHSKEKYMKMRRIITKLDIDEVMKYTDVILTNGNDYIQQTYAKFGKPMHRVWLSTHPDLKPDNLPKDQKSFLYFGGNGNIVKGLDLAIEAVTGTDIQLYICAEPESEYCPKLPPNVHPMGFVKVGSKEFQNLTSKCGYVILPSSSEGCATSVTTCMRRGLVPIVTKETGVDVGNFGHIIHTHCPPVIREDLIDISNTHPWEFMRRSKDTFKESGKYTQENFIRTFNEAICRIKLQFQIQ
jgi:hypothetical protein